MAFDNEGEAISCSKYMSTQFVRFLILITLASQHISRDSFQFVPLQDFTSESDVPWDRSIEEIDEYLFDKYRLSDTERDFIRKMIKPMN